MISIGAYGMWDRIRLSLEPRMSTLYPSWMSEFNP